VVDDKTRREIDKAVEGILKYAGLTEPSGKVVGLLQYLKVHRDFYDPKDQNLLGDLSCPRKSHLLK
jgi:hypothetical protein